MDRAIEQHVPTGLRHLAAAHWTPANVATRVAALLRPSPETRILDVGAGIGKLCTIGALTSPGLWCGVEQHASLVTIARQLASAFSVTARTRFFHADALGVDWGDYDALYFYNPFELGLATSPSGTAQRGTLVHAVERRLSRLRPGTQVVTLHGFGGVMPPSLALCHREQVSGYELALWRQRDVPSPG